MDFDTPYQPRPGSRWLSVLSFASAAVVFLLMACEREPQRAAPAEPQPAGDAAAPAVVEEAPYEPNLTAKMEALATQPAGVPTGVFIDRPAGAELRVVDYNVNWDKIFPEVDEVAAEKFQRVVKALDPDLLTLQEIGDRDEPKQRTAEDVVALLNAINPLGGRATWHAYKGGSNVIASKYPVGLTAKRMHPPSYRDPAVALVDLPDERFGVDLYVLNNHFKCCGGEANDPIRQKQADAVVNWIHDARTPGGEVDLEERTAIIITGDLNLVGGPQPLATLLIGDVINEDTYGEDFPPDWDGTELVDAHPLHNAVGPDDYTWRDDTGQYAPGRLDFIIYSDSVVEAVHKFVLNTTLMSDEELAKGRLEKFDVTLDMQGVRFDHLPVVVDFRVVGE